MDQQEEGGGVMDSIETSETYQNPETAAREQRDLGLLQSMDRAAQIADLERKLALAYAEIERLGGIVVELLRESYHEKDGG